ncbi:DinB family protein, partial [bacterium]
MEELRRELTAALRGGQACDTIEQILSEVPAGKRYERAQGMERSPWQVLDHMRFTLEDLIVYYTNSNGQYRSPDWPDDYWPATVGSGEEWEKSLAGFNEAQGKMEELISTGDLVRPFA